MTAVLDGVPCEPAVISRKRSGVSQLPLCPLTSALVIVLSRRVEREGLCFNLCFSLTLELSGAVLQHLLCEAARPRECHFGDEEIARSLPLSSPLF